MCGIYRGLILAIGLVLSSAKNPTDQSKLSSDKRAGVEQKAGQVAEVAPFRPYPDRFADACYYADEYNTSDLCAQWRAAIAAEKAAKEAEVATITAIIGTILSLVTVIGLIVTIIQTRGALDEARRGNRLNLQFERRARKENARSAKDQERALAIAEKQFRLSEEATKAQIRAYLSVVSIEPHQTRENFSAKIEIKNVGRTPARITKVESMFWLKIGACLNPLEEGPPPRRYYHVVDFLAQGGTDEILAFCEDMTLADKLTESDKGDVYVYGRVEFSDVFGDSHWMTFASVPSGWGFGEKTEFRPCIHGNNSD